MSVVRVLSKGQIVIPKPLREKVNISPGDKVEVKVSGESIIITPIHKTATERTKGVVKGKLTLEQLEDLYAEKAS